MRLEIAYSKIKKAKSSVVNKDAYQRETLTKWPVQLPLKHFVLFLSVDKMVNKLLPTM